MVPASALRDHIRRRDHALPSQRHAARQSPKRHQHAPHWSSEWRFLSAPRRWRPVRSRQRTTLLPHHHRRRKCRDTRAARPGRHGHDMCRGEEATGPDRLPSTAVPNEPRPAQCTNNPGPERTEGLPAHTGWYGSISFSLYFRGEWEIFFSRKILPDFITWKMDQGYDQEYGFAGEKKTKEISWCRFLFFPLSMRGDNFLPFFASVPPAYLVAFASFGAELVPLSLSLSSLWLRLPSTNSIHARVLTKKAFCIFLENNFFLVLEILFFSHDWCIFFLRKGRICAFYGCIFFILGRFCDVSRCVVFFCFFSSFLHKQVKLTSAREIFSVKKRIDPFRLNYDCFSCSWWNKYKNTLHRLAMSENEEKNSRPGLGLCMGRNMTLGSWDCRTSWVKSIGQFALSLWPLMKHRSLRTSSRALACHKSLRRSKRKFLYENRAENWRTLLVLHRDLKLCVFVMTLLFTPTPENELRTPRSQKWPFRLHIALFLFDQNKQLGDWSRSSIPPRSSFFSFFSFFPQLWKRPIDRKYVFD